MPDHSALDILKQALLLERRGCAFYQQVAAQTQSAAVREFFETMAEEELRHIQILSTQFKTYVETREFKALDSETTDSQPLAGQILSEELKLQIAAAGFEAAAISAAILMEERAVKLYGERAQAAADDHEQILYRWLADWERGHLAFLKDLDQEVRERIWNDNRFWPF